MAYHVHITPPKGGFSLKLGEVWDYRDLIILLTKKAFTLTYKQTILGPGWIILNPLVSSLAYIFVFGVVAGISTNGVPQILFYLASTAIWGLFSSIVTRNSSTFLANAYLFGKVYFPRLTVPISNALVALIVFGIQMSVVLVLIALFVMQGAIAPVWALWPAIPLVLVQLCMLAMGVGIIFSSFTTKYRDLQIVVSFGMSLWMFITPIVYPLSQIPEGTLTALVMLNPVSAPVEWLRYVLFGVGTVDAPSMIVSLAITVVVTLAGIVLFNRVERTFIDTV